MHLLVQLSGYASASGELVEALRGLVVLRSGKRGEVLVERGKRQKVVWFLHSGSAKEVSPCERVAGGRVSWFWFSSDFLFSFPGFFAQLPAVSSVELVEDSVLLELSFGDFASLRERFLELGVMVEKIRAHYEKGRVAHAGDLVDLSAKERFDKFFKLHKGLFNVVRHKDIASFLGIRDDGFHRYW
ncbi:MAG: Crp/Fnr family transcriptional regulator [Chitinophagaceae bacterium]|nr:MAG: Crp/Fnr family transcriptional regulator [Chitinophagaceae bacterium]